MNYFGDLVVYKGSLCEIVVRSDLQNQARSYGKIWSEADVFIFLWVILLIYLFIHLFITKSSMARHLKTVEKRQCFWCGKKINDSIL